MAERTLVADKIKASFDLASRLVEEGAPLLAAFWDWHSEADRWQLVLVPKSSGDERRLTSAATAVLISSPFRSMFSISDVAVDGRKRDRARALAEYVRRPEDIGRQFETTFTAGQYFEAVILIYKAPELARRVHVA